MGLLKQFTLSNKILSIVVNWVIQTTGYKPVITLEGEFITLLILKSQMERDPFIPPRPPFASWTLDEDSCYWIPPVVHPMDGKGPYHWDEDVGNWVKD